MCDPNFTCYCRGVSSDDLRLSVAHGGRYLKVPAQQSSISTLRVKVEEEQHAEVHSKQTGLTKVVSSSPAPAPVASKPKGKARSAAAVTANSSRLASAVKS